MFSSAKLSAEWARQSAAKLCELCEGDVPKIALTLGTGWGDALPLEDEHVMPLDHFLLRPLGGVLPGHARQVSVGRLDGVRVLVMRGRVHLNEDPFDDGHILKMVRLQTQMLMELGIRHLVETCAAGALFMPERHGEPSKLCHEVGDIVHIREMVTLFAPTMPLLVGEFVDPNGVIGAWLSHGFDDGSTVYSVYAMLRGPWFEGHADKRILSESGATLAGMSILPALCVAALYRESGVQVWPMAFVSNGPDEADHTLNTGRAKDNAAELGRHLRRLVSHLSKL